MSPSPRAIALGAAASAIALAPAGQALADTATITTPAIMIGETTISVIELPVSLTTPSIGSMPLPSLTLSGVTTPAIAPANLSGPFGLEITTPPVPSKTAGPVSTVGLLPTATPPVPAHTIDSAPKVVVPGAKVPSITIHVPDLPSLESVVGEAVEKVDRVARKADRVAKKTVARSLKRAHRVVRHARHVLRGVHVRIDARVSADADARVRLARLALNAQVHADASVRAGA